MEILFSGRTKAGRRCAGIWRRKGRNGWTEISTKRRNTAGGRKIDKRVINLMTRIERRRIERRGRIQRRRIDRKIRCQVSRRSVSK